MKNVFLSRNASGGTIASASEDFCPCFHLSSFSLSLLLSSPLQPPNHFLLSLRLLPQKTSKKSFKENFYAPCAVSKLLAAKASFRPAGSGGLAGLPDELEENYAKKHIQLFRPEEKSVRVRILEAIPLPREGENPFFLLPFVGGGARKKLPRKAPGGKNSELVSGKREVGDFSFFLFVPSPRGRCVWKREEERCWVEIRRWRERETKKERERGKKTRTK